MTFAGFQKLDLLNFPSLIAATVYTSGCNLRCPYCHNPELAKGTVAGDYTEDQVLDYLARRRSMLEGLVVSGGEPTLHQGLGQFLEKVRELGLSVKLDTNGLRPQVLDDLLGKGLIDYVALDIKAPLDKYEILGPLVPKAEIPALIGRSLEILRAWSENWEVRTTYLEDMLSDEDIALMARQSGKVPVWYIQAFNPSVTLDGEWKAFSAPSGEQVARVAGILESAGVNVQVR